MSGTEAKRGFKRETIFVNLVNNNSVFRLSLETALADLGIIEGKIIFARDVKSTCKSDVKLFTLDKEVGCSLKSAELDFNQLDRRWLSNWATVLGMPEDIRIIIQSSLDRKIISSRDTFILPEYAPTVLSFLESKRELLFKELFTKDDENLKAFIGYDENRKEWIVAKISEIVELLE
jgi:hypothetical protein